MWSGAQYASELFCIQVANVCSLKVKFIIFTTFFVSIYMQSNSRGSGLENRQYGLGDQQFNPVTLFYLQKLLLTSPTAAVSRGLSH
jgi:hypothetical protein